MTANFAAEHVFDAARSQFASDFPASFEMARDQHQKQIRETRAQAQELLGQDRIFTRMGAAADQQRGAGRQGELAQHLWHIKDAAFGDHRRIEFQTAHDVNRLRTTAQHAEFSRVLLVLGAHSG